MEFLEIGKAIAELTTTTVIIAAVIYLLIKKGLVIYKKNLLK